MPTRGVINLYLDRLRFDLRTMNSVEQNSSGSVEHVLFCPADILGNLPAHRELASTPNLEEALPRP
jgi:hypothetical protein